MGLLALDLYLYPCLIFSSPTWGTIWWFETLTWAQLLVCSVSIEPLYDNSRYGILWIYDSLRVLWAIIWCSEARYLTNVQLVERRLGHDRKYVAELWLFERGFGQGRTIWSAHIHQNCTVKSSMEQEVTQDVIRCMHGLETIQNRHNSEECMILCHKSAEFDHC